MNKEFRHFLLLAVARGAKVPLALAISALVARIAGPEGVGQWAMLLAAGGLLYALFISWTQAVAVRFGCEEWASLSRLDSTLARRLPLLVAGITLAAFALWIQPANWLMQGFGIPPGLAWLVFLQLVGLWLMSEVQSLMQITAGFARLAFVPLLAEAFCVMFLVGIFGFGVSGISVPVMLAWLFMIATLTALLALIVEQRRLGLRLGRFSRALSWESILFAWPLIPTFVVGFASDWCDQVILRAFFSNEEVGHFQVAYQLMLFLVSMPAPVATIILPKLIGVHTSDSAVAARYLENVVPTLMILWLLAAIPMVVLAPYVVEAVYGKQFAVSGQLLAILSVAVPGCVVSYLYGVLFSLQGRFGWMTFYATLMAGINIVISLALVPAMGAIGAAVGTAVSYLVIQGLYFMDQQKHFAMRKGASRIFLFSTVFSILIGMTVYLPLISLMLGVIAMALLVCLVRKQGVWNSDVAVKIFAGRLNFLAYGLNRVFAASSH